MGNPQKRKGDKYEVDLAKWFNENIFKEERCQRAPLSGGGKIGFQAGGADILGTPFVFIEAKRVERLNFRDAMAQAERNIIATRSPEWPVVVTRRNQEKLDDSYVMMRLKDWREMYEALLKERGVL
jgi:hypothetical protein